MTTQKDSMWPRVSRPYFRGSSRWRQFHKESAAHGDASQDAANSAESHRNRWSKGWRGRR